MAKRRRIPAPLLAIPFLTDVSGMLFIFAISRSLAEQGATLTVLGLVGAGHAAASSMSSLIFGTLSDRIGRARLIVPGMLLLAVAAFVCAAADTGRALSLIMYWSSAVALGMIHPATIAWFNTGQRAEGSRGSRGMSSNLIRFCVSWNLGVLVAQFGGGELFLFGVEVLFDVAGAVALIDVVCALRVRVLLPATGVRTRVKGLPVEDEPVAADVPGDSAAGTQVDRTSDTFVRLSWLANAGGAVSVSMVLHLFPSLAVGLGIESDLHGAILAGMRIVAILVYLLLHRTTFWQYRFSANVTVQLTAVAGLVIVFIAESPAFLLVGLSGIALLVGFNYFSGIYYGSSGHEEDRRGFASGMHEASLGLGIALGSAAGGILGSVAGERAPYLFAASIVLGLLAVQTGTYLRRKATAPEGAARKEGSSRVG